MFFSIWWAKSASSSFLTIQSPRTICGCTEWQEWKVITHILFLILSFFLNLSLFLSLFVCVRGVVTHYTCFEYCISIRVFWWSLSLSLSLCLCFLLPFLCFLSLYLVTMNSYTLFTFVFPLPLNLSLCIHRETLCLYFFADLSEWVCVWEKEKECDNQIK